MTVSAVATVTGCGIDHTLGIYQVAVQIGATDGTVDQTIQHTVLVPFGLSTKKADKFIRQDVANFILSTWGFTIDPDDIYIPFASD